MLSLSLLFSFIGKLTSFRTLKCYCVAVLTEEEVPEEEPREKRGRKRKGKDGSEKKKKSKKKKKRHSEDEVKMNVEWLYDQKKRKKERL